VRRQNKPRGRRFTAGDRGDRTLALSRADKTCRGLQMKGLLYLHLLGVESEAELPDRHVGVRVKRSLRDDWVTVALPMSASKDDMRKIILVTLRFSTAQQVST